MRLEAVAGVDNQYSPIAILGREHLAIKAGGAVYVTICAPVEVIVTPRSHRNWTEGIPALHNGTEIFVDPISNVITSVGSPVHCTDVAPRSTSWAGNGIVAYKS